jgi:GNAT superfamily N-acetyltransferase
MSGSAPELRIRAAAVSDAPLILALIRELAEYERAPHAVVATEDLIRETLFGPRPRAEVLLGYEGDEAVGFALFFHNYSTWLGRHGLYLEDLFVRPEARGRGHGRRLLARLAAIARERGCGRMDWAVLDWNEPAIGFYRALGAVAMDEWTVFRLAGDPLAKLADEGARAADGRVAADEIRT